MSQIIINGQPLYQVDLPEMTLAEWQALPVAERPKEWIRTDADYTDIPAENVEFKEIDINVNLHNATWTQSAHGKYYTNSSNSWTIPDCTKVIGVYLVDWADLRADVAVQPYIRYTGSAVQLALISASNDYSYASATSMKFRIIYY